MLRSGARSHPATFGALSALLAASFVWFAVPASAQSGADEALIGVVDIGSGVPGNAPANAPANAPDSAASATELQDFEDRRSGAASAPTQAQVFGEAMRSLERGQLANAQRMLEQVIGLDPDSETADEARRHLADLYRGDAKPRLTGRDADELPWRTTGSSAREAPATPPVSQPALREAAPPRPAVSDELERRFITEAGDRVFFSEASADLGSRARNVLAAQARWLTKRPELDVMIEGYADDTPMGAAEQEELSERRAEVVRQRLIAEGVDPQRLGIAPWGRDRRISECNDPSCAAQNRRAVTVLVMRQGSRARAPLGAAIDSAPVAPRTTVDWNR